MSLTPTSPAANDVNPADAPAGAPQAKTARKDRAADKGGGRAAFIWFMRIVLIVGFLGLWEWAASSGRIDPILFGQPSGIVESGREYFTSERALDSILASAKALAISFVVGSLLGTIVGLVLGLYPTLNAILGPFLAPLNSVPRIALAPLFIAWFGLTTTSKVVLAVSIVFFILAENARSAVRSVDSDLMMMSRVVGLKGPSLLWKLVLPSAVPTIFAGLRLCFTYALLGVVASEMVAATDGIGQDIVQFSSSYQINTVFAILVFLMLVAIVVNWIFQALEGWLLRWQHA